MLIATSFENPTVVKASIALILPNSAGRFKLIASVRLPKMVL